MEPFFIHQPSSLSEFVGQDDALKEVNAFFSSFKKGKALFLYGPPGTGKTSMIHAFAKENGYDILELNASDARNQSQLKDFLSRATGQMSLFGTKKIILLDEVDGLSGTKDRGAPSVIASFISSSSFPIVMTGVNVFDKKFSTLKKSSVLVQFSSLRATQIKTILEHTLKRVDATVPEDALVAIARNAAGDVRAALNDLFSFIIVKDSRPDDMALRKKTESLAAALIKVFKSTDPSVVFGAYDDVDEDLDKIFLWVDQNIAREYAASSDLAKAFEIIAHADRFFGRIRRWQHYRFYVYCYALLSVGVALSKEKKYMTPPHYKQPSRLLRYWQANMQYAKRKAIVEKLALATRTSTRRALHDSLPLLLPALVNDEELQEQLEITSDEKAWLEKQVAFE